MGLFIHNKNDEAKFPSYFKCDGDIEVDVFDDGTNIFDVFRSYL